MLFELLMVMELLLMVVLQLELLVLLVPKLLIMFQRRQILLMMWMPSRITSDIKVFLMLPRIEVIVLFLTHPEKIYFVSYKRKRIPYMKKRTN